MKFPLRLLSRMLTVDPADAISSLPSPLMSPKNIVIKSEPTAKVVGDLKEPLPLPKSMLIKLLLSVVKEISIFPSPLKSPIVKVLLLALLPIAIEV